MAKLIIMQGLPASGKSTRAQEIIKERSNTLRINRDLLREMLHFGKWTGFNERQTTEASYCLARHFLTEGFNVIIDDTNLNPKTVERWENLAKTMEVEIEYVNLDTSVDTCIMRDFGREKRVGSHVIVQMALQNGRYPIPLRGFIVCDIDGTLANIEHRRHFVQVPEGQKKDWDGFFGAMREDTARREIVSMVEDYLYDGYELLLVSGRSDKYRDMTEVWLETAFSGTRPWKTLIMRREGDKRPDTDVKGEIYERYLKPYSIHRVIDDRPSVIRMWQSHGLNVVDVGDGKE